MFVIFLEKSSKVGLFSFLPTGLSFIVAELRSLPVWITSGLFLQKSSKIGLFSLDPMGIRFAVAEMRSLWAWGEFREFSTKIIKIRPLQLGSAGYMV